MLKLAAVDGEEFERVIAALESAALAQNIRRVTLRSQTGLGDAYLRAVRLGYRAHWTDLRMSLSGFEEVEPQPGAVVWSNWEI